MPRFATINGGLTGYTTLDEGAVNPNAEFVGSTMLFLMPTPPTGWVKDTTNYNNSGIRITSGIPSPSGSVAYTSAMASYTFTATTSTSSIGSVSPYTLTTNEMSPHKHLIKCCASAQGPNANGTVKLKASGSLSYTGFVQSCSYSYTSCVGGGGSHTHSSSPATMTISSVKNMSVKYVDAIFATYV